MFQTDSTFYKDSINSAIVPENSIIQSVYDLNSTVSTVAHNTTPYDFGLGDLVWWNFGIAILALVASLIAAYYGYLGFRYQKRAAISLEQMKGKVIEFEIYIRILYSSLSDIFTIHRCFKASGYNIGLERICEKIMIPENLIDPNLFSNHEEIYRRAVNIKISIIDFNKDVNIYLRSIRTATSESIVDKLFEELIKLPYKIIYNIGYVVELIKLNENDLSFASAKMM